ncbi:MAG: hypothetical protein ABR572_11730 [Cryomorphaceae bacterium]|nr:hypothetical protein [Flavobacteriales bacterium]
MHFAGRSVIFKKSFPLMVCELTDAMMLFSGVMFLTLEDEVYLAAIGLIDAFLLCCLAYGFALSDAFRNFYARKRADSRDLGLSMAVHRKSRRGFLLSGITLSGIGAAVLFAFHFWYNAEIILILLAALPFLLPVVAVYYIGLSFHSFLIGRGHLTRVGWVAVLAFLVHLILLYIFLNVVDTGLIPTNAVLLASLLAESFWLALLWAAYRAFGYGNTIETSSFSTKRIRNVLRRAAYLPGLSLFSFHFACALIFVYLSWCCAHAEAALLTLAMSYYALLIAPVNGISDAAANGFSFMYAGRRTRLFFRFRKNLFAVSIAAAAMVFVLFAVIQYTGVHDGPQSLKIMAFTGVLAVFGMRNKIDFTAVLVRLHIGTFFRVQLLYALTVVVGFVLLRDFFAMKITALLPVVLFAQVAVSIALRQRVRILWFAPSN